MPKGKDENTDWIDGFLFVGNQLALDLLNTKLVIDGETVDLLPDSAAFKRWSLAAGILTPEDIRAIPASGVDSAMKLCAFRERLREAVITVESDHAPKPRFISEINQLLSRYSARIVLSAKATGLTKKIAYAPEQDGLFWGAIAASVAELLTELDPRRIRRCENCVIHFYDISKKGSRRWCSMNLCGNKLKVAAYQKRRRSLRPHGVDA